MQRPSATWEDFRHKLRHRGLRCFDGGQDEWLTLTSISEVYSNVTDASQLTVLQKYKLEHRICQRRKRGDGEELDVSLFDADWVPNPTVKFKPKGMCIYVKLADVFDVRELRYKLLQSRKTRNCREDPPRNVVPRLAGAAGVHMVPQNNAEPLDGAGEAVTASIEPFDLANSPLIQLEPHELFRNEDQSVVQVELRGERSIDKILFKAADIGKLFGMTNLAKSVLRKRSGYQKDIHYVILSKGFNDERSTVNRSYVFLTYRGLDRVLFTTASGNKIRQRMVEWSSQIMYVHQLGSEEDRYGAVCDPVRFVLNQQLYGLYFVDFGSVLDLRERMEISQEKYPAERYGRYRIGKLGYTKEFPRRYSSLKSKYQDCTDKITPRWFLLIPRGQLEEAETRLKQLVVQRDLKFNHEHYQELVIYDPADENMLINIYRDIADAFPCVDFDKKMTDLKASAKGEYLKKEFELKDAHRKHEIEFAAEIRQLIGTHAKEVADLKDSHAKEAAELKDAHAKEVADLKDARASDINRIHELELQLQLLQQRIEIQELRHLNDEMRRHD